MIYLTSLRLFNFMTLILEEDKTCFPLKLLSILFSMIMVQIESVSIVDVEKIDTCFFVSCMVQERGNFKNVTEGWSKNI